MAGPKVRNYATLVVADGDGRLPSLKHWGGDGMTRVWDYGGAEGRGPWVMQPHRHTIWLWVGKACALVESREAFYVRGDYDALTCEEVEEGWYRAGDLRYGRGLSCPEGWALVEIMEVAAP